jgi:hypothetical protein
LDSVRPTTCRRPRSCKCPAPRTWRSSSPR